MKKLIAIALLSCAALTVKAQEERKPATPGQTYGETIDTKGAMDIAALPALLEKNNGQKTAAKIKAKVVDVCPKKGCWMNLYINDSTTAFVKMKDYGFFVPMDMIGKTVVLEGEAMEKITSVNELRHYAEDAKKPQSEIDAITQPQKSIRFMAKGIKVPE
ncbi:DUF4920 domain-containing protein [Taibaiella koreensis]|uniref:DUF4920 domain-containing protein n=1 Tax=Taibaiella koreensis TaxID=1268548 RepID=UPI000E59FF6C|nr:DUF4920 domain-containing protein [Taibaiella koreensis]